MVTDLGAFLATGGLAESANSATAMKKESRSATCFFTRESLSRHAVRQKHLGGPALTAEEMDRVAPRPRIGRIAHRAECFVLRVGAMAMIAGDRSGERHILFTTHFAAGRAAPADGHLRNRTISH